MTVITLGPEGTFSHDLTLKLGCTDIRLAPTIHAIILAVARGEGEGIVPIENSEAGGVGETLDSLTLYPVYITGEMYPSQDKINATVLACHEAGFQVAIHAVTRETVEAAIIALEYADCRLPVADSRHRIEHCSECPPGLLERLKKLNTVVVTQPPFLHYSGERYLESVSGDRFPWLYRIKSLSEAGLIVAGSSDSPIVSKGQTFASR